MLVFFEFIIKFNHRYFLSVVDDVTVDNNMHVMTSSILISVSSALLIERLHTYIHMVMDECRCVYINICVYIMF